MRQSNSSIYSFVGWISSYCMYLCYLIWVFSPRIYLEYIGFTYYPSRYYAIALPAYFLMVYILWNIGYLAYNMMQTADPEDFVTFLDVDTNKLPTKPASLNFVICNVKEGIPEIGDINPIELSKIMLSMTTNNTSFEQQVYPIE